ncbi:hypothetical protein HG537_0H04370 [Torulaspora globosa]|uniref:Proteasome assembly chaperone 2 n=1 Tax=Torulaspora globosa TaxID=48254 RepID=A0A7H9HY54_9SACH|nr:hypothetical protein HG537_0H04370 [Torulaspora sp. CBS 2947]
MAPTLIVPLVSTGNVPQLTVDLLLHSLSSEFSFVRSLDSTHLHPFVGPLDYVLDQPEPVLFKETPEKTYSTALELFYNASKDIYVVQQRTPVIRGYLNNYLKDVIIPLIEAHDIEVVVLLDSFGSLDQDIAEATRLSLRTTSNFISNGTCEVGSVTDIIRNFQQSLNLNERSASSLPCSLFTFTAGSIQQEITTKQQVFNFAYHILNASLPALKRIRYCSAYVHEGDNSEDAHLLCDHLTDVIESLGKIVNHTPPVSWKGVYGSRPIPSSYDEGVFV